MRTLAFIVLFLTLITSLRAQPHNFKWVNRWAGSPQAEGYAVTVDQSGNIYSTGAVSSGINTGQTTVVTKMDPSGKMLWEKFFSVAGNLFRCTSVAVDKNRNVFLTGVFNGTSDFDPGAGVFEMTAISEGMFVIKLDSCSNFAWAKQVGGYDDGLTAANCITVDQYGNIYTTGSFTGTNVDFDPGAGTHLLSSDWL
jgi:hypothetical protein